jgi:uncharacterized protein
LRTGVTLVPLHGGHCPPWLFEKMKQLGTAMVQIIVAEYGAGEVLRRLSDPVWFQTFGSVLGFDWHSSGLTTVVSGALKEGLHDLQGELGLFFAGGKGKASRQTPEEIQKAGELYGLSNDLSQLQRTSRLVAKVDSAAVQDGYQLYHHLFIFDSRGNWAVVQQGMNENSRYARRYHWLSESLKSFVDDPHRGVCGIPNQNVLNLVAHQNEATRLASVELCREDPDRVLQVFHSLASQPKKRPVPVSPQLSLWNDDSEVEPAVDQSASHLSYPKMVMPASHPIPAPGYLNKILYRVYEKPPQSYEGLLETPGVGPSTLRALTMVAEVTHGARPSFEDPVRYTFAHGGKDSYPFPVSRCDLEHSIQVLRTALEKGRIGEREKLDALRKLADEEKRLGL